MLAANDLNPSPCLCKAFAVRYFSNLINSVMEILIVPFLIIVFPACFKEMVCLTQLFFRIIHSWEVIHCFASSQVEGYILLYKGFLLNLHASSIFLEILFETSRFFRSYARAKHAVSSFALEETQRRNYLYLLLCSVIALFSLLLGLC